MKQRKRWMAVLTVWTIALLFAAGFTSQASVSGSEMIQEKNSKYTTGAGTIAAAMESIPAEAVELTKAEAQKAQEAREQAEAEAKRKAEEEAARKAAEEAARAQIAAEDQKLLASIIFCEAGNQPYEGQVAVGAVIMNRVRSGVYPNSISEVIYQSGQFWPGDDRMAGYGTQFWRIYADCHAGGSRCHGRSESNWGLPVFWKRELWDSDRGSFFPLIVEKECGYCLG